MCKNSKPSFNNNMTSNHIYLRPVRHSVQKVYKSKSIRAYKYYISIHLLLIRCILLKRIPKTYSWLPALQLHFLKYCQLQANQIQSQSTNQSPAKCSFYASRNSAYSAYLHYTRPYNVEMWGTLTHSFLLISFSDTR